MGVGVLEAGVVQVLEAGSGAGVGVEVVISSSTEASTQNDKP